MYTNQSLIDVVDAVINSGSDAGPVVIVPIDEWNMLLAAHDAEKRSERLENMVMAYRMARPII